MLLVLLLYALFASVFTTAKLALFVSTPLFLIGFRMALAGFFMLLWCYAAKAYTVPKKMAWVRLILLGAINIYLTNALEVWGLQYLTSFKTCFIYSLSPYLSALFSYFLFSEVLSKKKWAGLLIGCLGFTPILLSQTDQELTTGTLWLFSWAELAVIGAVVSSVLGWMLLQKLVRDDGLAPMQANGFSMLFGGVLALIHSPLVESWQPTPVTNWSEFLLWTAVLIVTSNCIAYNLYGYLLRRFSATFMSFAGLSTPYFTALFGALFLQESLTLAFFISSFFVALGLGIFYLEELQKNPREFFGIRTRQQPAALVE